MSRFSFIFFFFGLICCYGQNSTGLIHYGEIQSMGMGGPVGPDYNALLLFDNNQSLYITRQDSLEGGHIREQTTYAIAGGNQSSVTVVTNEPGFRYFNDLKNKDFYSRDIGFNYVKEKTPTIYWKVSDEKKKIGDHVAYKATGKFRGREYTAWFTLDLPLPYGPWKLQGLPGLILEAYDTNKEIYWYFKALQYPTEFDHLLKPIVNTEEWIGHEDYAKWIIRAYKNAQVAGRMAAESADIPTRQEVKSRMLNSYIEGFEDRDNK
jgi:GLPGLI family protein